jgi:hypothetical protein
MKEVFVTENTTIGTQRFQYYIFITADYKFSFKNIFSSDDRDGTSERFFFVFCAADDPWEDLAFYAADVPWVDPAYYAAHDPWV